MKTQQAYSKSLRCLACLALFNSILYSGAMLSSAQQSAVTQSGPSSDFLAWDADSKNFEAKPGELTARFIFYATNTSSQTVVVTNLQRSCGCTEATMPSTPWTLPPGSSGAINATIDLRGKAGKITKMLTVQSTIGSKPLSLNVDVPHSPTPTPAVNLTPAPNPSPTNTPTIDRTRNQQAAALDRQAVFQADCAKCHAEPTVGKMGHELYQAGCAICHEAEHRAEMVPDLHKLTAAALQHSNPSEIRAEYWSQWITSSRPGSMMPAFAKAHGGPLNEKQIASLVDYLTNTM
jgi:mono/diheme cytochrome c family protein